MINRIIFIFIGLIFMFGGFVVYQSKCITYFGYRVPLENSKIVSFLIFIFGVLFIYAALKKNFTIVKKKYYFKCADCGVIVEKDFDSNKKKRCRCGGTLENLSGFFDRHPDLK